MNHSFPSDFVWGSSTAAYQVEGAWNLDGKAPSVWDTAFRNGFTTPDGTSGDTAIDQYHRLDEDLDLLADLSAGAHRFSVSWPRIVVDASGTVNPAGLDYYDRLIDGLRSRGIAPALCLYHWDTPQWMEDLGGMMNRDLADRFADYAAVLGERFGDRVAQWYTLNEPVNPSLGGYFAGAMPPQRREGIRGGLTACHHLMLAHGRAVQALRATGVAGQIGTIVNLGGVAPATDHPDDIAAAARAEYFEGRIFLDPLLGRGHLPEIANTLGEVVREGDDELIAQRLDVLGVNWYSQYSASSPERASAHGYGVPERGRMITELAGATAPLGFAVVPTPGARWSGAHRQITPGGLRAALDWVREAYPEHPDLVITENGLGDVESPDDDGVVHDSDRVDYLAWVLAELQTAIAEGHRVRGFHVWSSFDNLQWMAGFTHRFGLIHVDSRTFTRTPKDSFTWYRQLVRTGVIPTTEQDAADGDHNGIDVEGVRNARGVGGLRLTEGGRTRDGVLFRSAGLHKVTDAGEAALLELGVATILDLRGDAEIEAAPDPQFGPRVVALSLHDPDASSEVMQGLPEVYADIIDSKGAEIVHGIREILGTESATLVHCTAGKDRTGMFVAIVLSAAGVCDEDVVSTYAESGALLGAAFAAEVRGHLGDMPLPDDMVEHLMASPAEYAIDALAHLRRTHGSVPQYLFTHGLTVDELDQLQARFRA